MIMWLRIACALAITVAAIACLEALGVGSLYAGRSADEASREAHNRARDLFWMMVFAVVMATAVLAAARRWAGHLRRALAPTQLRRRDLA